MKKIIEKVIKIGDDEELTNLIACAFGKIRFDELVNHYACVVYIDTVPKQLILAIISESRFAENKSQGFVEELKWINHNDFNSLLLLVTTYPNYNKISKTAGSLLNAKNFQLDKFLEETRGWLVYGYQLEKLFMMGVGCDAVKARDFRKNINKKDVEKTKQPCMAQVFGVSINEIIRERMKLGYVSMPKYYEAYRLYCNLNKY